MGDRANIVIEPTTVFFTAPVFFYTHWNGYEIKPVLQSALKRGRKRWDDAQYLARIIFCEMIQGDVLDETGYGISTVLCDNSYPLLCVDIEGQKVREREANKDATGAIKNEWTFEEFLSAKFKDDEGE